MWDLIRFIIGSLQTAEAMKILVGAKEIDTTLQALEKITKAGRLSHQNRERSLEPVKRLR